MHAADLLSKRADLTPDRVRAGRVGNGQAIDLRGTQRTCQSTGKFHA